MEIGLSLYPSAAHYCACESRLCSVILGHQWGQKLLASKQGTASYQWWSKAQQSYQQWARHSKLPMVGQGWGKRHSDKPAVGQKTQK
eukprot:473292-Pelagomonas_calceolata.AAC.2